MYTNQKHLIMQLSNYELNRTDLDLLEKLESLQNAKYNNVFASNEYLAKYLNITIRHLQKILNKLQKFNLIDKIITTKKINNQFYSRRTIIVRVLDFIKSQKQKIKDKELINEINKIFCLDSVTNDTHSNKDFKKKDNNIKKKSKKRSFFLKMIKNYQEQSNKNINNAGNFEQRQYTTEDFRKVITKLSDLESITW